MEDKKSTSISIEDRVEEVRRRAAEQDLQESDETAESDFLDDSWNRK